jgi:hypothetical protein
MRPFRSYSAAAEDFALEATLVAEMVEPASTEDLLRIVAGNDAIAAYRASGGLTALLEKLAEESVELERRSSTGLRAHKSDSSSLIRWRPRAGGAAGGRPRRGGGVRRVRRRGAGRRSRLGVLQARQ